MSWNRRLAFGSGFGLLIITATGMLHKLGYVRVPAAVASQLHNAIHGPDPVLTYGMRVLPPCGTDLKGIVDEFGQYAKDNWPGKIKDASALAKSAQSESASLPVSITNDQFDQYGGWLVGPKLTASGFFRTQKLNGRWWLVTPEGHVFFSIGMDGCGPENSTIVDAADEADNPSGAAAMRRAMFQWLPGKDDPLYKHVGSATVFSGPIKSARTFDFYQANIERKYGPDYLKRWNEMTVQRLRGWNFNTLGATAVPSLRHSHFPYVAKTWTEGGYHHVSSGKDIWGKLPDPFDSGFKTAVDKDIAPWAASVKADPWCLGYFIDNEMSWAGHGSNARWGIALGTLNEDATRSPAKQEFIRELKARYPSVQDLNSAWRTNFSGWSELEDACVVPDALTDTEKSDMQSFILSFARAYFKTVRAELRSFDSNHLYLGCRFADKNETPEVIQAAGEACDVVSFNIYRDVIDMTQWPELDPKRGGNGIGFDKPILIGEFHFGANDTGLPWAGMDPVARQPDRAQKYRAYVDSVADLPNFVGCHWFRYTDEPVTGRPWDGENGNIGFVSITDTPYSELTKAATDANADLYRRHSLVHM